MPGVMVTPMSSAPHAGTAAARKTVSRPRQGSRPRGRKSSITAVFVLGSFHGSRHVAHLPRGRTRRRKDLRHALRGTSPPGARHGRGRRARRALPAPAHRAAPRRLGAGTAPEDRVPGRGLRRAGRGCGTRPCSEGGAGRRTGAHQRARLPQRRTVAGRAGTAGGRHRCDLHGQYPAPGVTRRCGGVDHRGSTAGDGAGRGGPAGRSDRAGRHVPTGTAPPDGARQHPLPGQGGRRAVQLLPPRQPDRAAGAGTALGRRPGRRVPAPVPRRERDRRGVAGT